MSYIDIALKNSSSGFSPDNKCFNWDYNNYRNIIRGVVLKFINTYHGKVSDEIAKRVDNIYSKAFKTYCKDDAIKLFEEFKTIVNISDFELNTLFTKFYYDSVRCYCIQVADMFKREYGTRDERNNELKALNDKIHRMYRLIWYMDEMNDSYYIICLLRKIKNFIDDIEKYSCLVDWWL